MAREREFDLQDRLVDYAVRIIRLCEALPNNKTGMYKKQRLYQQEGKRQISIHPEDLPRMGALLKSKLRLFGYAVGAVSPQEEPSR
jgi:hypothetical protein